VRRLSTPLAFVLGAWTGFVAAARFVKRAFPSHGDEESDAVSLVAVFDGVDLKSRARAFSGGTLTAWFGGVALDLRGVTLAPGARLTVHTLFGGIAVKVPPHWRVETNLSTVAGGVDVHVPEQEAPDAPLLSLDGTAVFGGVAVVGGATEED
jgi:hypothetical protein